MSLNNRFLAIFSSILIANCSCRQNSDALANLKQKVVVIKQLDDLYFHYANESPKTAEGSLVKGIDILEKSSCFNDSEREGLICLEYSRLAVMAHKLGKKDEEEAYFLSAKYFQLKCLKSGNMALQEAIKVVNQMSIEHQTVIIEKMDRNLLNGRLPNYNQGITNL